MSPIWCLRPITSRDELYQEALTHTIGIWADLFEVAVDDEKRPIFLRPYMGRKIRHSLERPEMARMFTNELMREASMMRRYLHTSRQAAQKVLERTENRVADGLIRPLDPFLLRFIILALTRTFRAEFD